LAGLRESALYASARRAKKRASALIRERGLRDTGEVVEHAELGLPSDDYVRYEASAWRWLPRALRGRTIERGDVFVDLGSGKGRVVLAAARYPFARVIGVEITASLTEFARENVARAEDRIRCGEVELVTADVVDWPIPPDVNYVYLFNPLQGEGFRRVVANIVSSLAERPRRLTLIYANPTMADVLDATDAFRLVEVIKNPLRPDIGPTGWVNVYESS